MSSWKINSAIKRVVLHSAGITSGLTAGVNLDDFTVACVWLGIAVMMVYTAQEIARQDEVQSGWQKFVYVAAWGLFLVYSISIIGGFLIGIFGSI